MSQRDIWKIYITAQSKILEHKSRPIGIDTSKPIQLEGLKLKLHIDQDIFKRVFKEEVERVFKVKDFDFNYGYILTGIENAASITNGELSELKALADICYIDFNDNPVVEGEITAKKNSVRENLKNIASESPTNYHFRNSGLILLTIDEWRKASRIKDVIFDRKAVAVFRINPSVSFLISTFYKNIKISQTDFSVRVTGELHQNIYEFFQKHFGLIKRENRLIFKFKNAEKLKRQVEALGHKGIMFPQPRESFLYFNYDNSFYKKHESDLTIEASRLKRSFKSYFPGNDFEFSYETEYTYDEGLVDKDIDELENSDDLFWKKLFSEIPQAQYQISRTRRTISFSFGTEEELTSKIDHIKSYTFVDIYDRGIRHKYKFNIRFETGLHQLQASLKKEYPNLFTRLIANGEKLIFRKFYKSGNKAEISARLRNQLDEFIDLDKFSYTINDSFQEKYLCEENFDLKVEEEEEKLSKLMRENFFFGDWKEKLYLGKLQKVDYPELYFVVEEDKLAEVKENIASKTVKAVWPDLKGEKDKIKRLEETVIKLDSNERLPNDNAREFLYDSSRAKKIENIDYLLDKTTPEWQEFEDNLFSKSLNESQKQAIYKSLYAEELALIQGPPGTGKSTAIAEIIWQHIRKDQRQKVLLTSETNLAVDNAINRLKNEHNNLVKPVRFGNDDKLESEGYFYSLSAIENWKEGDETQNNAVTHWIDNISNRIINHDDDAIDSALEKWKDHLQKPSNGTKKLFADKYLEYANLIGATGSSIGKINSENKWTSFFRSYLNVFNREDYEEKNYRVCNSVNISFDTIIMDEASKATPTELALPVLYGKKSIIVGDHRQLPPIIDGEEIKDMLNSIGEQELANTLSQKEFNISQFERLFENIDESIKGTFDTQYRMHPAINEVISQFYEKDGGLHCGLPLDEFHHNSFDKWDSRYHGLRYGNIITPETHVIWVNVTTPEIREGNSRVNFGEIDAIDNILTMLNGCAGKKEFDEWLSGQGLEEKQIGIISFYGKQIQYINQMIKEKHHDAPIRLSTVDRFQGMERNIIIVSMVRSNKIASFPEQQPDELYGELGYPFQGSLGFAESPNRLNVALSRARRLLIIIGNSEHFCRKEIYKNVHQSIQTSGRGRIVSAEELQKAVEENEC